ncbi:MAG: peptidoglycan bridge formation glycyltransferase FemA/FemB family protein [Candidatus Saccharimonas sp.]
MFSGDIQKQRVRAGGWSVSEAGKKEIAQWDDLLNDNVPFTQTREFAEVKRRFHWTPRFVIARKPPEQIKIVILERKIPFLGVLWYIPCGPTPTKSADFEGLMKALGSYGEMHDVFLIKTEPLYIRREGQDMLSGISNLEARTPVQPPNTLLVETSTDAEFATLGRRARRYARQARAEGVIVKEAPVLDLYCETMYNLMQTANGGKGVPGQQSYEYYAYFWKKFHEFGTGSLFFAYEGSDVVAGAYIIKRGKTVVYKDGGSTAQRTSSGATYYLHAEIMRRYASEGFKIYDMWGMPPISSMNDRTHPLFGIGQFKLAFSKDIIEHAGCYEYTLKPLAVRFWRIVGYRVFIRLNHWRGMGNFW